MNPGQCGKDDFDEFNVLSNRCRPTTAVRNKKGEKQ
jgi:hypothetical protein